MADSRIRLISIKTGVVKRISAEKACYEGDVLKQQRQVDVLKASGGEKYYVRKQEEVLQECLMMVPDCNRRLEKAIDDLSKILETESDLSETEEYSRAQIILKNIRSNQEQEYKSKQVQASTPKEEEASTN